MKTVLGLILMLSLAGCASKGPENAMRDPSEIKAEAKARDDFAKSLPKPPER